MDKRITIGLGLGLVIIGLGVALFIAQPKDQAAQNSNDHSGMDMPSGSKSSKTLQADLTFYDFGTISMKNGVVSKEFTVKNPQNQTLTLHRLYTSCMCTKAYFESSGSEKGPFGMLGHGIVPNLDVDLAANAEGKVKVEFDPNAHGPAGVGPIEREVTVEDNEGVLLTLSFKANVVP